MKRIISIIISVALLLCTLSIYSVGATDVTVLTVTDRAGNQGDIITVNINISSNSKMQACGFELNYNKNVLEIISSQKGSVLSGTTIVNSNKLGKIIFSYAAASPVMSSGTILSVTFKIKDNASYGESEMALSVQEMTDGNFNPITTSVRNGYVTVIAPALDSPSSLEIVEVTDRTATLLWNNDDEATGYNLYLNGNKYNTESLLDNTITLTNLMPDTTYSVRVTTMHYTTESASSDELVFRTEKVTHKVVFTDCEPGEGELGESVIAVVSVKNNEPVTPPTPPQRQGYRFLRWSDDCSNITSSCVIYAIYELIADIGDTDLDGKVNIRDVTQIQRHLAQIDIFSNDQLFVADTNGDGKVDITDATHLQQYLVEDEGVELGKL